MTTHRMAMVAALAMAGAIGGGGATAPWSPTGTAMSDEERARRDSERAARAPSAMAKAQAKRERRKAVRLVSVCADTQKASEK